LPNRNLILAIETSCDDTSVALVSNEGFVFEIVSASQDLAHEPFGGIVPEIACRNHSLVLLPLIDELLNKSKISWSEIAGIAVTNRPGLIGSLIVGIVTAKSLAQVFEKPLIGVNHLEGHIVAPFLFDSERPQPSLKFPFIALAVSGGHTSIYQVNAFGDYAVLGSTLDDAAGEAFDKFAKMAGLGFPGGIKVDQLSKAGNPEAFLFPRGLIHEDSYQMSFSGLKSSAQRILSPLTPQELQVQLPNLCASFQEAVVDALIAKLDLAMINTKMKNVVITGGVSANSRLREKAQIWAKKKSFELHIPPLKYCTDNAAMIGFAGALRLARGEVHDLSLGPSPRVWPGDFKSGNFNKGRQARVQQRP
jgi:N6-L-threonylcarbamoyladenine synthase